MPGIDLVAAVSFLICGLVWLVRLEGRVNALNRVADCVDTITKLVGRVDNLDQLFIERKNQVTEWLDQHEDHDQERHLELKNTLAEIKATLAQAPKDAEAASVLAQAKIAAQDVVAAAKVVAQAVATAADLAKAVHKPRPRK